MRTHRFVGATSREVLHKVKQALGDDALILSNRSQDGQIEVVAMTAAEVGNPIEETEKPVRAPARTAAERAPAPADFAPAIIDSDDDFTVALSVPAAPAAQRAPAVAAAPAVVAPAAPAPAVALPAPVVAAPAPMVATSSVLSSVTVSSIPALASAAVTRSTASPASVTPSVFTRPAMPAAAMSWPAAHAPQGGAPQTSTPIAAPFVAAPAATQPAPVDAAAHGARSIDGILNEIQNLKNLLQRDSGALATADDPVAAAGKSGVMHELLNAGFSAQLSRQVADEVCIADPDPTIDDLAKCIERELWVAGTDEIINRGGVYALVGPTGVGKTTTIAKLAARAVVRFGASKVALLTTDSYRVGAHDQLRVYGRLLGVGVHAIRDAQELANVLAGLQDRHLILIDTIGMSQRDRMVAEQAAMLAGCGDVKRVLLVQSTANARTLEQVVVAYKKSGIDGCILTKTDEAASIAPALDVIIRHQLPLHYVTDGQRVPEDLHLPDAAALVREALSPTEDEVSDVGLDELPFMIPTMLQQGAAGVAHV